MVKFGENFQIYQSYEIWSFFSFFSVRQPRRRSQSKGCRELGRPAEISCTAPELCLEVLTPRPGLLPHLPVQGAKYAQFCLIKTQLCHLGLFYIIWANLEKIMKFGENCDWSGVVKFDENFQIFQSYEIWSILFN